eukprot:2930990-Prymnesium_polylepis.2
MSRISESPPRQNGVLAHKHPKALQCHQVLTPHQVAVGVSLRAPARDIGRLVLFLAGVRHPVHVPARVAPARIRLWRRVARHLKATDVRSRRGRQGSTP